MPVLHPNSRVLQVPRGETPRERTGVRKYGAPCSESGMKITSAGLTHISDHSNRYVRSKSAVQTNRRSINGMSFSGGEREEDISRRCRRSVEGRNNNITSSNEEIFVPQKRCYPTRSISLPKVSPYELSRQQHPNKYFDNVKQLQEDLYSSRDSCCGSVSTYDDLGRHKPQLRQFNIKSTITTEMQQPKPQLPHRSTRKASNLSLLHYNEDPVEQIVSSPVRSISVSSKNPILQDDWSDEDDDDRPVSRRGRSITQDYEPPTWMREGTAYNNPMGAGSRKKKVVAEEFVPYHPPEQRIRQNRSKSARPQPWLQSAGIQSAFEATADQYIQSPVHVARRRSYSVLNKKINSYSQSQPSPEHRPRTAKRLAHPLGGPPSFASFAGW